MIIFRLRPLYEGEHASYEASQLYRVHDFSLPSSISVVMESISIFNDIAKFLNVGRIENLLWRVYSLIANPTKRSKQCSGWEMLGACDTKKRFNMRA